MSKDSQAPVDKDYASGADAKMVVDPKAVQRHNRNSMQNIGSHKQRSRLTVNQPPKFVNDVLPNLMTKQHYAVLPTRQTAAPLSKNGMRNSTTKPATKQERNQKSDKTIISSLTPATDFGSSIKQ